MLQLTIRYGGSTFTIYLPTGTPTAPLSDLAVGITSPSDLLAEINRRYGPRVRCVRGHLCSADEFNRHRLCPRCLRNLGLS